MAGAPPPAPSRRERLEALLASGQASVERARSRSLVVDTVVSVAQRERPVGVGILAGSLAFRLFALLVPLIYVLVAGLGFAGAAGEGSRFRDRDNLGALVVDSVATAARTSERGRWLALLFGGLATLLAANGVVEVLRWVHVLAWRVAPIQARRRRPLLPLGLVAALVILVATSTVAHRARADAEGLASELTVILVTAGAQAAVLACCGWRWRWCCRGPPGCPGPPWCRGRCCSPPGSRGSTWPSPSTSPRGRRGPPPSTGRWGWP